MESKEIIMNDVNVRKCKHFKAWYESRPNGFGGITIENYCYLYGDNCEKYPQCLFRSNLIQQLETQLKRKEEELQVKEQECEKLKDQLTQVMYLSEGTLRLHSDRKNIKYKQALDEIKKVIKSLESKNILTFPDLSLQENVKAIRAQCNSGYKQILDIINKVKGEQ